MSPWPTARLSDVADINPRLSTTIRPDEVVSFVPMSAVSAERAAITSEATRYYADVAKGFTPFVDGDVLVAKITPCFENGKIAQATLSRQGFGSTEFHVVRPRHAALDGRYLLHFLRQDHIRVAGERRMTGSAGQRRVPEHFLSHLRFPLPPLREQRRIAAFLDKADVLRAKRRATLAQLHTLTQSIFLEMFGDSVTNSRNWPRVKLEDMGSVDRGVSKHRPRNAPELLGGAYPFVQTGDIANCDGYIRSFTNTYSEAGLKQSRMWPKGTLCITIAANIAKTGILTFDACFPDSVVGFRCDDAATVQFVRVSLSFLQKALENAAPESAQKNINLAILRGLEISKPGLELQREFALRLAAVEQLMAPHRASLRKLDALFSSLQHRAFRGEL